MAERDDGQEKTEQPSELKRQRAREQGQRLQSKDLQSLAALLTGGAALAAAGSFLLDGMSRQLRVGLSFSVDADASLLSRLGNAGFDLLLMVLAIAAPIAVCALLVQFALGGGGFSVKALAPQAARLDPMKGLKRLFGLQALYELCKTFAKAGLVLAILASAMAGDLATLGSLTRASLVDTQRRLIASGTDLASLLLGVALFIALLDVLYQWWRHRESMMMTLQEAKDERKQTDGSPELRARVRRAQHEASRARAVGGLTHATVVLVNPTHFLVALAYEPGSEEAPVVCAKARGAAVRKLTEESTRLGIPVLRQPPLTRAIFFTTELGEAIRKELYQAVAVVLAHVLNGSDDEAPAVEPPDEFSFDEHGRPAAAVRNPEGPPGRAARPGSVP